MRLGTLLLVLLLPYAVRGQTPGTCESGMAQAILDANDVRATLFNRGNLFFGNAVDDGSGYVVPFDPDPYGRLGPSPIYAAGLWIGGKVEGELRVVGARYSDFEYWPGPLQDGATLPNPADCSAYDRIFVVSRQDVARYLQTGEATDDLRDWPYDLGAPVLDGDGINGNYDLEAGDQPAIYGAQTAWWVMNDVGNVHAQTESDPLGVEVQVTAFASPDGALAIRQATFYRYLIMNKNTRPIEDAYVSFWSDPDLGDATDDYVAADTTYSMGIVYNGDVFDHVYGIPPALGHQIAQGPVGLPNGRDDDRDGETDEPGERLGLTAFSCAFKVWPGGDPGIALEYYYCMQGRWLNGLPITEGRDGYQTDGAVTPFLFPGDPVEGQFWSEVSEGIAPGGRRLVITTGPFQLDPGETEEIVIALPFAQGSSHLDSVTQLRLAAQVTQNAWDFGVLSPSRVEAPAPLPPDVPGAVELTAPTPNPFRDRLTLRYTLPDAMPARVTVLDVLGREVAVLAQGEQAAGPRTVEVDTERWPSGVYLVRVDVGTERRTFSVVKVR